MPLTRMGEQRQPTACTDSAPGRLGKPAWLLLLGYSACLFLAYLGSARTLTGHESILVEISREMVQTGDWLIPHVGRQPFLEKPPLPHWIVAVLITICGEPGEYLVRLPSALAGLLGVAIVASLAARWFGRTLGLFAGLVQATTIYTMTYARLAESDIYLWLIILLGLWLFAREQVEPRKPLPHNLGRFCFLVLLGLTNLIKGPLFGAILLLAPCVAFLIVERRWRELRWFLHWPGLLAGLLVALAWPTAVLLSHPESIDLWLEHTVGRLHDATARNPKPAWYYLTTLPWQVLPWTPLALLMIPAALRRAWRARDPRERFLLLWLFAMLVVLSMASGKHHHYLIYALPPCSVWAAAGIVRLRGFASRVERRAWPATALFVTGCVGYAATLLLLRKHLPDHYGDALVMGGLLVLGLGFALTCWRLRLQGVAITAVFASVGVVYGYLHAEVTPRTDSYREQTAFLRSLVDPQPEAAPLLVYKNVDVSRVALYTRRQTEFFEDLHALRCRIVDSEEALVLTGIGYEPRLREIGTLHEMERVAPPGPRERDPTLCLALYRVQAKDPRSEPPRQALTARP